MGSVGARGVSGADFAIRARSELLLPGECHRLPSKQLSRSPSAALGDHGERKG